MIRPILAALSATLLLSPLAPAQLAQPRAVDPSAPARGEDALFRHPTVQHAWDAAQASGRPILLYVTSDNCRFCKKMLNETLRHPQIGATLRDQAEPVSFNASRSPELAQQLGVRAYPTTLLVSPENKLLGKIEGFVEPAGFAERVWPILRASDAERRVALRAATPQHVTPASMQQAAPPNPHGAGAP